MHKPGEPTVIRFLADILRKPARRDCPFANTPVQCRKQRGFHRVGRNLTIRPRGFAAFICIAPHPNIHSSKTPYPTAHS